MKKLLSVLLAFVMLASAGSLAVTANAAGKYSPGDVSGDGVVGPEDARLALRASVGLYSIRKNTPAFSAADVNNDGAIKADDARKILRASVGLEKLSGGTATKKTEFDYLKSGNFYLQGTMTDSSGQQLPLEMAVTQKSVYMLSTFEGAAMGMLISNGTPYMIYPAEKSYLELNATVLKAMGMSVSDLVSAEDLDYSQFDLSKADAVRPAKVNGVSCREYIFYNDDPSTGSTRFYLNGNKLVRFAAYDGFGRPDTINDIGYITDNVPADKINPPADYKEYKGITGMFSFISLLGD